MSSFVCVLFFLMRKVWQIAGIPWKYFNNLKVKRSNQLLFCSQPGGWRCWKCLGFFTFEIIQSEVDGALLLWKVTVKWSVWKNTGIICKSDLYLQYKDLLSSIWINVNDLTKQKHRVICLFMNSFIEVYSVLFSVFFSFFFFFDWLLSYLSA